MIKKSPRACQIFCNASAAFFRYDCIAYLPTDSVPPLKIDHFHKISLFFYIRDDGKGVERNFNWHCTVVTEGLVGGTRHRGSHFATDVGTMYVGTVFVLNRKDKDGANVCGIRHLLRCKDRDGANIGGTRPRGSHFISSGAPRIRRTAMFFLTPSRNGFYSNL